MKMDPETLERLLMDRALGSLPPDAEALLEAYLSHDAAAAERAREFVEASDAARQVLRSTEAASLPPFPVTQVLKLERARRGIRWLRNTAGIAATLVVGIGLGAWFTPASTRAPIGPAPTPTEVVARPTASFGTESHSAGFWSVSRLAQVVHRSESTEGTKRLIWDSPIARPRLGGSS